MAGFEIEKPHYPIVYVRGYAMTPSERQDTFNDTYYGFSATSVEKREAPPPRHFEMDVFEGQLIRLMTRREGGWTDGRADGVVPSGLPDCLLTIQPNTVMSRGQ